MAGEEFVEVEIPEEFSHLMVWYEELRGRAVRGMGIEPVQFSEIEAYNRIYDIGIDGHDIELLCRLDVQWMIVNAPKPKGEK